MSTPFHKDPKDQTIHEMAMLLRQLCRHLPMSEMVRVQDYLSRKGLANSALRSAAGLKPDNSPSPMD